MLSSSGLDVRRYADFAKLSLLKIRVVHGQGRWQNDDSRADEGKLANRFLMWRNCQGDIKKLTWSGSSVYFDIDT
eukprot:1808621-Amphidinium_carterae.1